MNKETLNGPHRFAGAEVGETELGTGWRWRCSCGQAGRWQYQSDTRCEHDHVRHVEKIVEKKAHKAGTWRAGARRMGRKSRRHGS